MGENLFFPAFLFLFSFISASEMSKIQPCIIMSVNVRPSSTITDEMDPNYQV